MSLSLNGWRPGMLLDILQGAGQLLATKHYLSPNVSKAKVRNLGLSQSI